VSENLRHSLVKLGREAQPAARSGAFLRGPYKGGGALAMGLSGASPIVKRGEFVPAMLKIDRSRYFERELMTPLAWPGQKLWKFHFGCCVLNTQILTCNNQSQQIFGHEHSKPNVELLSRSRKSEQSKLNK
jgi:hypothetical protein